MVFELRPKGSKPGGYLGSSFPGRGNSKNKGRRQSVPSCLRNSGKTGVAGAGEVLGKILAFFPE